jgi:hypothetical protein
LGGGGEGDGCLFTFFTIVNILLLDIFFDGFFIFIFMKQIQNNQKSIGNSIPTYGFQKSQEKN